MQGDYSNFQNVIVLNHLFVLPIICSIYLVTSHRSNSITLYLVISCRRTCCACTLYKLSSQLRHVHYAYTSGVLFLVLPFAAAFSG